MKRINHIYSYYPFGMAMPGRSGHAIQDGWASGNSLINGQTFPADIDVSNRSNNTPADYTAANSVNFIGEYEDGGNDEYLAYILDASNTATSSTAGNVNGAIVDAYRYGFNGKEKDGDITSPVDYDFGARIYDGRIGRWLSLDPLQKKYTELTPYNFVANSPIQYIDPDGKKIIVANPNDRIQIEYYINSVSKTQYTFNKKGELIAKLGNDKKPILNNNGSDSYSKSLNEAITNKKTISIKIGQTYKDNKGNSKSVDNDAGGGVTQTPAKPVVGIMEIDQRPKVAGDPAITISGNPNGRLPNNVYDGPELILMHEIVGHALPIIKGKMDGNAVENENKVRKEIKAPLRTPEPNHKESNFGN